MDLKYEKYEFTPVLGWSISRYEVFDKCKRQYYYNYYPKFVQGVPLYKMQQLKNMTSVPLEIGNVVHDVLEAFLRRLQKSDSNIDEARFYEYAEAKTKEYFSTKTFIEVYYGRQTAVDVAAAYETVSRCLANFIGSPIYSWIFMKAMTNRASWMIEPPGYGETRLAGLKAYCKMDFLFPVDGEIAILDWKTGKRDTYKHGNQLIGYAAAASSNFGIPWAKIFPKIVYLNPVFDEFELTLREDDFSSFLERVKRETVEMQEYCADVESNKPAPIERFVKMPSESLCAYCNYQELCFPERKPGHAAAGEAVLG
jgi:hypothetical protein